MSTMKTTNTGRVMVIAAHPDDEVLGCGATVHKLVSRGWKANLVIMSAGVSGRHLLSDTSSDDVQRDQASLSAQIRRAASVMVQAKGFK
jgi:LmbE family N-acetylglucosaminyl deacetylase